jgi:hypothetical protein
MSGLLQRNATNAAKTADHAAFDFEEYQANKS